MYCKTLKTVRAEIMERLEVSKSRAALYTQTEIPGTLREARLVESEDAEDQLGIKTALLWTSPFKPTTRTWHASRSGHTYSLDEVRAFYATNGNRFCCYCAQTEALLDADGKPILTKSLHLAMVNGRKT